MLFLPTCATVDYWSDVLPHVLPSSLKIPVMAIHGKMKEKRRKVMEKFRSAPKAILLCTDVLARGIDIPEVDWVLQWDPPASASAFVHRVGRTARQGNIGSALILLLPSEETYVDFIQRNQRVKLNEIPNCASDEKRDKLLEIVRKLQMGDRGIFDKANRAFVSHVRAYSKHECSLLLRVKDLPLINMATGYCLLQLPKMPEFKNLDIKSFPQIENLDINTIAYKDKQKEIVRKKRLTEFKKTGVWPSKKIAPKKQTEAWSKTKQLKQDKKEKKAKRKAKKVEGSKKKKRKFSQEDMDELVKDIALLKKYKKKKISDEDFEKEIGLS